MQKFIHTFFCKIKSLCTINNLCVVIEIIASSFPYGLKMMSRNTLSEPQPDSASYRVLKMYLNKVFFLLRVPIKLVTKIDHSRLLY